MRFNSLLNNGNNDDNSSAIVNPPNVSYAFVDGLKGLLMVVIWVKMVRNVVTSLVESSRSD